MTGEGRYDPEYERLCYQYRYLFSGRDFGLGASWLMPDWFVKKGDSVEVFPKLVIV